MSHGERQARTWNCGASSAALAENQAGFSPRGEISPEQQKTATGAEGPHIFAALTALEGPLFRGRTGPSSSGMGISCLATEGKKGRG
jgi:hypothetical protein